MEGEINMKPSDIDELYTKGTKDIIKSLLKKYDAQNIHLHTMILNAKCTIKLHNGLQKSSQVIDESLTESSNKIENSVKNLISSINKASSESTKLGHQLNKYTLSLVFVSAALAIIGTVQGCTT